MTAADERTDLDERLARYAAELDGELVRRMASDASQPTRVEAAGLDAAPPVADRRSRRVWLATAAAVVLVVAASVVVWRGTTTTELDVTDSSAANESSPAPDPGGTAPLAPIDPLTWSASSLTVPLSAPGAVTPFGDGLLAVGTDDVSRPVSWRSIDGVTWGPETAMSQTTGVPASIATDGSTAVAVGMAPGNQSSWVTTDGVTWEAHPFPGASKVYAVAHTADGFLAVGSAFVALGEASETIGPAAWRSIDGRTWTFVDLPRVGTGEARDVVAAGDTTVVVGVDVDRPVAFMQTDGTWSRVELVAAGAPGSASAVAAGGGRFVAAGSSADRPAMWESPDGVRWSSRSLDSIVTRTPSVEGGVGAIRDVAVTDRAMVVIPNSVEQSLDGSYAWASIDGGEWTQTLVGANRVTAWGDRFVALGLETWVSSSTSGS